MFKGVWAKEKWKIDVFYVPKNISKEYRFYCLWKVFIMVLFQLREFEKISQTEELVIEII